MCRSTVFGDGVRKSQNRSIKSWHKCPSLFSKHLGQITTPNSHGEVWDMQTAQDRFLESCRLTQVWATSATIAESFAIYSGKMRHSSISPILPLILCHPLGGHLQWVAVASHKCTYVKLANDHRHRNFTSITKPHLTFSHTYSDSLSPPGCHLHCVGCCCISWVHIGEACRRPRASAFHTATKPVWMKNTGYGIKRAWSNFSDFLPNFCYFDIKQKLFFSSHNPCVIYSRNMFYSEDISENVTIMVIIIKLTQYGIRHCIGQSCFIRS